MLFQKMLFSHKPPAPAIFTHTVSIGFKDINLHMNNDAGTGRKTDSGSSGRTLLQDVSSRDQDSSGGACEIRMISLRKRTLRTSLKSG